MVILTSVVKILAALFLVLLNGFFVLAEFSLVKVRRTRLAELSEDGAKRAETALEVTSKLDAYLSACQLGITLASLGLGWLGEPAIAALLNPLFESWGWSMVTTHTVSTVIAFTLITFLHIVFGELIPKSMAIHDAEKMSMLTAGPLKLFDRIFYPIIWFFNAIAVVMLRKFWGIDATKQSDEAHSPEELKIMVEASERYGFLDRMEGTILENVLDFSDRVARDVMVPRQDMVVLYVEDSFDEAIELANTYGYVRYPLCDGSKDNVVGMIHIKDLLRKGDELQEEPPSLVEIKRDIMITPETKPIVHLLQKMRADRVNLAIVADEFGGVDGLVTVEDLVEELSGQIYDEFELEEPLVERMGSQEWDLHGRLLLADLSDVLGVEFEEETGVSTVGGFISAYLGRIAKTGDKFTYEGYTFDVLEMERFRVKKVKVYDSQAKKDKEENAIKK